MKFEMQGWRIAILTLVVGLVLSGLVVSQQMLHRDANALTQGVIGVVSSHPSKDNNYLKASATSGSTTSKNAKAKMFKHTQAITFWAKGATKSISSLKLKVEFRPTSYTLNKGWTYNAANVFARYTVKGAGPAATKSLESWKQSLQPGVYTAAVFYHEYATNTKYGIWADLSAANSKLVDVKYLTFVVTCPSVTTFDANGGKIKSANTLKKTHNYGAKPGKVAVPVRKGYAFKGFYTQSTGGMRVFDDCGYVVLNVSAYTNANGDWQRSSANKLYAQWALMSDYCVVSFDVAGGTKLSADNTTRMVKKGSKLGSLPTTKRSGYKLVGWFTKSSGGTKLTTKSVVSKAATFYAQWKKS